MIRRAPQILVAIGLALLLISSASADQAIEPLKERYLQLGAITFDPVRGKKVWHMKKLNQKTGKERSCTDCHGSDLTLDGRHLRTGKVISAISPAVTPERFTSIKKVEKWFKRNCKWTFGRPCSPQEKGDILTFIQYQTWNR